VKRLPASPCRQSKSLWPFDVSVFLAGAKLTTSSERGVVAHAQAFIPASEQALITIDGFSLENVMSRRCKSLLDDRDVC
jgi:hypothetical protein